MTEQELIEAARALPGVVVDVASKASGAPEVVWGDVFCSYDPDGTTPPERRFPFATIVHHDSDGATSIDGRPGVFRVNFGLGRARFEALVGHGPSAHRALAEGADATVLDRLIPHPVYFAQSWVSILNPGERTAGLALELLREAYDREAARHGGTAAGPSGR